MYIKRNDNTDYVLYEIDYLEKYEIFEEIESLLLKSLYLLSDVYLYRFFNPKTFLCEVKSVFYTCIFCYFLGVTIDAKFITLFINS